MSTILEHSANAFATIQHKGRIKYGKFPHWVKRMQLEGYYSSMSEFYSECLDELIMPKKFDKKEIHQILVNSLKKFLTEDKELTSIILRLISNYPTFPMGSDSASKYISALKALCRRVAMTGIKANEEIAIDSIKSDIPYVVFSNFYLSNYTISYFHEYIFKITEQHFRRNFLLVRGRPKLSSKKIAIKNYLQMIEPTRDMFRELLKTQLKLWLLIVLSNSEDIKEFSKKPSSLEADKIDQRNLEELATQHSKILEEFRRQLFTLEPTLFDAVAEHKPTQTMWRNMSLLAITEHR